MMEPAHTFTFTENYVSGLIRAIRFGLENAHGGSNAIQLNFLMAENVVAIENDRIIIRDKASGVREAVFKLAANILDIQEKGDLSGARKFVDKFCKQTKDVAKLVDSVKDIPTDIRIRYDSLSPVRTGA
jgi:hypothetical protein